MTRKVNVVTIVKVVNRKNRKFTIYKKFFRLLTPPPPSFPPAKPNSKSLGKSKPNTFGKGPQKPFSLSIYDFTIKKIVNVYRFGQLQGQENYAFTIFSIVTTLTSLVILKVLVLSLVLCGSKVQSDSTTVLKLLKYFVTMVESTV
jgi:hypothetical protein